MESQIFPINGVCIPSEHPSQEKQIAGKCDKKTLNVILPGVTLVMIGYICPLTFMRTLIQAEVKWRSNFFFRSVISRVTLFFTLTARSFDRWHFCPSHE